MVLLAVTPHVVSGMQWAMRNSSLTGDSFAICLVSYSLPLSFTFYSETPNEEEEAKAAPFSKQREPPSAEPSNARI